MTSGWWVYLALCSDGKLYTGATVNLERRLRQHNGELAGGAKFTCRRRPVELVFTAFIGDKILALRVEWRLKRASADWKRALIRGEHEGLRLEDLDSIPIHRRPRRKRSRRAGVRGPNPGSTA